MNEWKNQTFRDFHTYTQLRIREPNSTIKGISIECNVVLCELGGKRPQMTAWVELDGSYFCFSDCFALIILTTVPFYRLLASTICH